MTYVLIAVGGMLGANARYLILRWAVERFGPGFPYGTLIINLSGAFLIGLLVTALTEWLVVDPRLSIVLVVGFLGSFTTFSTYTFDAFILADQGDWPRALGYVLGSNVLCLTACVAGVLLMRALAVR
jgi:fluoride exporter